MFYRFYGGILYQQKDVRFYRHVKIYRVLKI